MKRNPILTNNNVTIIISSNNSNFISLANKLAFMRVSYGVNSIPSASLDFAIPYTEQDDLSKVTDLSLCELGKDIEIKVDEGSGGKVIFRGIIVSKELTIENNNAYFSMRLKHPLVKLENIIRSQIFKDKTNSEIAHQLCTFSDITVENQLIDDIKNEQLVQFQCSDWHFFRYCLDANGFWFIPGPRSVKFIKPEIKNAHQVLYAKNGDFIDTGRWKSSLLGQPRILKVNAWDMKSSRTLSVEAKPADIFKGTFFPNDKGSLGDANWNIDVGIEQSKLSLSRYANSLLQKIQLGSVSGEFKVLGSTKYKLGETLELNGFGHDFDGAGIVTGVQHTFTPSMWTTSLTIGEHSLVKSKILSLPGINGLYPGRIASYAEVDPQGLFRIQVHLPILSENDGMNKIWARFAMPYASKDVGFICYPEPGDEVLLSFYEGNPNHAVIIGSVHNPSRAPAINPGESAGMKGWCSKNMQHMVDLQNNNIKLGVKNNTFTMDASDIDIKLDGSLRVNSKEVSIKGERKVTIKGNKIDLTK